jgi:Ca2+-binding RTX toxin-like protein
MHQETSRAARGEILTGTDGNDDFRITAPTAVDGGGGYDTVRFDFSYSPVGIRLDLAGLWTGGVATLNGYEISGVEAVGSAYDSEAVFILLSEQDDTIILGSAYPGRAIVYGGSGNDVIVGTDTVFEEPIIHHYLDGGAGDDVVVGGAWNDDLIGEEGNDRLDGNGGDDTLLGGDGRDQLRGGAGDDGLAGGPGGDRLFGGAGNDYLRGDEGRDVLHGGAGADVFAILDGDDGQDVIADFNGAEGDRIDLSQVDADHATTDIDPFTWIGSAGFSGTAGELRVVEAPGGDWQVSGDQDGDAVADFSFVVHSDAPLTPADFIL